MVDTLLEAGITVVVISPNQLKNLRGRYGSAGNKDDRFDAFVLADTLRTDRSRLRPLLPDTAATATLRRTCRARKDLVGHRVALANQLRAHLRIVFPGVVGLFADLDSPISLAFLPRFDCQDRADWLSVKRLAGWLAAAGYCGRVDPAVLHGRLTGAPRGVTGEDGAANAHITRALLAALTSSATQIKALDAQIAEQLSLHADAHIFTSLPRSGTVRAARLLAGPVRRVRARRHVAHRPVPAAPPAARHPGHGHPAPDLPPPQRPRRPPGCVGQSAARAPARRLSGCGRVVR